MPEVPKFNLPKPPEPKLTAIYCFRPGASKKDMEHDIAEIEKFIDYIRAQKHRAKRQRD